MIGFTDAVILYSFQLDFLEISGATWSKQKLLAFLTDFNFLIEFLNQNDVIISIFNIFKKNKEVIHNMVVFYYRPRT